MWYTLGGKAEGGQGSVGGYYFFLVVVACLKKLAEGLAVKDAILGMTAIHHVSAEQLL